MSTPNTLGRMIELEKKNRVIVFEMQGITANRLNPLVVSRAVLTSNCCSRMSVVE